METHVRLDHVMVTAEPDCSGSRVLAGRCCAGTVCV
jgi:hypothetical protein